MGYKDGRENFGPGAKVTRQLAKMHNVMYLVIGIFEEWKRI